MALIFDSHAHYDDTAFDTDRDELLCSLPSRGVGAVINAATDPESSEKCIRMAHTYPYLYAAVGIHPEAVGRATDDWLTLIARLARQRKVVAIGEIGLDYHYDDAAPRDVQRQWFCRQLALAKEMNLPVIVHDRDAHEDVLELLREYRPRGVVHCFSGSVEMMREVVDLGMYIGIGGVVTFKNAKRPVSVAAAVDEDRLLLETDAPYMAPEPYRGHRCDSSLIRHTAQRIAEIRAVDTEYLIEITNENATRLFLQN